MEVRYVGRYNGGGQVGRDNSGGQVYWYGAGENMARQLR